MTVFVCIDDRGGMIYNNRRVSRDSVLIENMKADVGSGELAIAPFSEKLLAASGIRLSVKENFLSSAKGNDMCFVENVHIAPFIDKIKRLVIYKWNRRYPFDMQLDIEPTECGFKLASTEEFQGSSHDKITKEVYCK